MHDVAGRPSKEEEEQKTQQPYADRHRAAHDEVMLKLQAAEKLTVRILGHQRRDVAGSAALFERDRNQPVPDASAHHLHRHDRREGVLHLSELVVVTVLVESRQTLSVRRRACREA